MNRFVPLLPAFAWIAAFRIFAARRRNAPDRLRWIAIRRRLPSWVVLSERLIGASWIGGFILLFGTIASTAYSKLHGLRTASQASPLAQMLIILSCLAVLPLALLATNLTSWAIGPVRRANLRAMGLDGTYRQANSQRPS